MKNLSKYQKLCHILEFDFIPVDMVTIPTSASSQIQVRCMLDLFFVNWWYTNNILYGVMSGINLSFTFNHSIIFKIVKIYYPIRQKFISIHVIKTINTRNQSRLHNFSEWVIVQLYHDENKLIFNEMILSQPVLALSP
jgi:hypothetical protein